MASEIALPFIVDPPRVVESLNRRWPLLRAARWPYSTDERREYLREHGDHMPKLVKRPHCSWPYDAARAGEYAAWRNVSTHSLSGARSSD
jgi:hypothetical protein